MAETVITSVATQVASEVAGRTASLYNQSDESTKDRVATGVGLGTLGLSNIASFPRTLIFAAINFFILSVIFVSTLMAKLRALYRAGDQTQENYVRNAFIRGLGFALIATVIFAVVDFLSGGVATVVMFILYPLAGVAMLVLSLIAPSFLNDITEQRDLPEGAPVDTPRETVSRISAYRLWSVVFWPLFIIAMIVSLAMGALISYLGVRISRLALDMLAGLASNQSGALNLGKLINIQ